MLFVLNIDGLIIIHINLNSQINKQVKLIHELYLSCYSITNSVMFEFVNFNMIIIRVMFGLTNIIKYIYIDMTRRYELPPLVIICCSIYTTYIPAS